MIRLALLATLAAAVGGAAWADPCPPSVRLTGDPALVAEIARELGGRGIGVVVDGRCPSPHAHVARRGARLVVVIDNADGSSTERIVREAGTAATVIESFTRTDVAMPLLATRSIPVSSLPPPLPPPPPSRRQPPPLPSAPGPSIQLAAGLESALASDGTTWMAATVKLCIKAGPVCAAARFRSSKVIAGLDDPGVERDLDELLIGVDVPLTAGRFLLTPGFAVGIGGMSTRAGGMERETGGFRAEAQLSLSLPIVNRVAIDLSIGAGLGDETDFDGAPLEMVPEEPRAVFRAGLGLRYGPR